MREGEGRYTAWKKRNQSLSYIFKEELESTLANQNLDTVFASKSGSSNHPQKVFGWGYFYRNHGYP